MRYSVCVIDNDIPASGAQADGLGIVDTALLNTSNLRLLLAQVKWEDEVIKDLITRLLAQTDQDGISPKWNVYGFTNPSFYINAINEGFFRSDVLVFDWEYPGAQNATETNSESILLEILSRTFCLVFIFSKADKKAEIEAILAKEDFLPFKERVSYLDKASGGLDQTGILLQKANDMYEQNFSFKFAGELRRRSTQCADQILSDMGRASLNDVKNLLLVDHSGKKDLVDFLAERFRTTIAGRNIYQLIEEIPEPPAGAGSPGEELAAKVWSYRLYFQQETGDDLVRRGDIVRVNDGYLLVLSADCDLGRFWKKNLGIINAVSLHELSQSNLSLKQWLTVCVAPANLSRQIGDSLLGRIGDLAEGPFILPFLPLGGKHKNFIAIPKELLSTRISTPAEWGTQNPKLTPKQIAAHPMKYAYWQGAERICTISEPFLTPVVQHILATLGGNGVPDYPEHMTKILKGILTDFSTDVPTQQAVTAPAVPALPVAHEPVIPVPPAEPEGPANVKAVEPTA